MLDLKVLRDDPEGVAAALRKRGGDAPVAEVLELDATRRRLQAVADQLRAEQKRAGADVAALSGGEKAELLARLKTLSEQIADTDRQQNDAAQRLRDLLLVIPNIPHESVPVGVSEDDNVEIRRWGDPPVFDFEARDHLDIGEALDIIDIERAARTSGSRFSYLKGAGAQLWWAVMRFALDTVISHGHTAVVPPVLVRREAMEGTGFVPTGEDQIYRIPEDDLYLVGTSEVPLAAMHMDEILDPAKLPIRYVAHSACFRREAGAHGKDTRGIFRMHQFEKVEMYVFCRPEDSWAEHERLIGIEEQILRDLELPFRTVALCTADMGVPSAKTVDLEVWFPGQSRYRETTSCSNTTDYQARRLNVRYRSDDGMTVAHTLNGTAATSSRTVAAILENFQNEDGTVRVPRVLQPYCGFSEIS